MATPEQEALQRVASDPRTQWGWGPSALASPEEQRAYEAYQMIPEVQAGRASVADLPEEYGGRPRITAGPSFNEQGQPVGTFRRQLRMQEMWDEEQKQALEQQRVAQQIDLQQRAESRLQRAQDLEMEKYRLGEEREARVVNEAGLMIDSIRGQMGPDGKWISKPIRPDDPDALDRLDNLARQFKFGIENEAANTMFSALYRDASNLRESAAVDARRTEEQQESWLVGQQEEAASFGVDTTKFFKADPETGAVINVDQLGLSKAIGEAKRKDLENKKREIVAAKLDEETKSLARSVLDEINKTDAEIRKANFDAARTKGSIRDENIAKAEFLRGERDVLVERFNSFVPQKPTEEAAQPPSFDSVEAAEAANLPKGTIVVIGGRRARID